MSPQPNTTTTNKDETTAHQTTTTTTNTRKTTLSSQKPPDHNQNQNQQQQQQQPPPIKCPRCDSPNTKFCYYNNYSLTQPRHFCKTCRRYWTNGGALRNVPIGGGCRKNKKMRSSSSSSSSTSAASAARYLSSSNDSNDSASGGLECTGLKFFHGIAPAMDFQFQNSRIQNHNPVYTQFSSFGDQNMNLGNFNFPLSPPPVHLPLPLLSPPPHHLKQDNVMHLGSTSLSSMNVNSSIASSIESLSSINQDLHWKLQQQRLTTMIFGGAGGEGTTEFSTKKDIRVENLNPHHHHHHHQQEEEEREKPQTFLFQNLEISKANDHEVCGSGGGGGNDIATEWFFDTTYAPVHAGGTGGAAAAAAPTTSNGNGNNNWNGVQAWNDLHHHHY